MAQRFFVTIEGEKTGAFKGESLLQRHQGQLEGLGFQYGLSLSYDLETGGERKAPARQRDHDEGVGRSLAPTVPGTGQ
jgi:hypothetical protein